MLRNVFTPPCGFDLSTTTVGDPASLASIAYWGYRLVVHPSGDCFLHETYYDQREGILGIAREPARPCGPAADEIRRELKQMGDGLDEPALRFRDYVSDAPSGTSGDGASGEPPSARAT